jgi:CHASE3 domain sensor protein
MPERNGPAPSERPPDRQRRFVDLTIGAKLNGAFGLLVLLVLLVVALIFWAGRAAVRDISLTQNARMPAALASARAQASLLEMQASVRGYLALGDLQYIDDYNKAAASFVQNLNELKALATDWTNDADVQRLRQLDAAYTAWAPIPRTLFELHDNPIENQPALRLENTEFRPVANVWAAQLATLIQLQEERSVTPEQRALLTNLIDLQTSFQGMVTNLRAYAITGDVGFKYGYADNLVANGQVFAQINTRRDIMSPEQRGILDKMTADRAPLLALPLDIFAAREGNQSVRDLYLFRTETEPLAATMLSILDEITTAQRAYLQADLDGSRRSLTRMQYQTLFGGLLALGLGAVMARPSAFKAAISMRRPWPNPAMRSAASR